MFEHWGVNTYERQMSKGGFSAEQCSLLAGLSRSLRLNHSPRFEADSTAIMTASGVIGPMTFLFVWWVLFRARELGVKRLYFLARDGQLMFRVAKVLAQNWKLDLDLRYLYCSRESLFLPAFDKMGAFERHWITWGTTGEISWTEICHRLGLSEQLTRPYLKQYGLEDLVSNKVLSLCPDFQRQLENLLTDEDFCCLVRERSQQAFDVTCAYLNQEGMFENEPFALVDTGWRGSSQYALNSILSKVSGQPTGGLTGFYLGLGQQVFASGDNHLEAFLFDWRRERRDDRLASFLCYEMLCSADHGRTSGYRKLERCVMPILDDMDSGVLPLINHHHRIAVSYADQISRYIPFTSFRKEPSARMVRKLLRTFICTPTPAQAQLYGNWRMAGEIRERDCQPLAPPMGMKRFIRCVLGREKIRGFWPQASLIRSGRSYLARGYNLFLASGFLEWYRKHILKY